MLIWRENACKVPCNVISLSDTCRWYTYKMRRSQLMLNLARKNYEDSETVPQVSYKEKVYHYLENLKTGSEDDRDPYRFSEPSNDGCSEIDNVHCKIDKKRNSPRLIPSPSFENFVKTSSSIGEKFNEENNFEALLKYDAIYSGTKTVTNDSEPVKKIDILDYHVIPARLCSEPNNNRHGTPDNFVCITPHENDELVHKNEKMEVDKNSEKFHPLGQEKKYNTRFSSQSAQTKESMGSFSDAYSFDVDYTLPSDGTDDYSSDGGSDPNEISSDADVQKVRESTELQNCQKPICTSPSSNKFLPSKRKIGNKTKKDLCPFCFDEVDHFSRHLFKTHSEEESVKKISEMPLKSKERRVAITSIRKKGNFILYEQKNTFKVVRLPNQSSLENKANYAEYFPCASCLGFYKKSYLWRHKKICNTKIDKNTTGPKKHLTESQTFLATSGMLGNILLRSRVKKEVFSIMRPDDISFVAKTDSLICLFGESYINKHKRKQINTVVSNKMRELARLKIILKNSSTIQNLMDILKPEHYELLVAATKIICGYDAENMTFTSASLALHMGTTLKFLCDVATKAVFTKNPLFLFTNRDEKIKEIKEIRHIINMHWCNDISSLANKVLNEKKILRPKLLPLTEDVKMLNMYTKSLSEKAFNNLKNNEEIKANYKLLTECTLVLVLVFNRKRVGEVQFLNIASYENSKFSATQEECLSSLSELEKTMSTAFKRVVVFGKGSKPVPILFTKRMQEYIEMILTIRRKTEIVPESNSYIFANPGSSDRWMSGASVLRKYAHKCGAKNPSLLTGNRFRKQIATILQLMNFEHDEMEQIARFMGHTEKTHKEFYRLTEDIYQTAKVAKVLLLMNSGKGSEFKGKSLAEIEVSEDIMDYEEGSIVYDISTTEENEETNKKENETSNLDRGKETDETEGNVAPSNEIQTTHIKKNRIRWTPKEKKMVLSHFIKHVQTKRAPKKFECLNFIDQNGSLFSQSDWIRIKTFVYNTYRDK